MTRDVVCQWCDRPSQARRGGGSPQRFCCSGHRAAFHSASRRWAERALSLGKLSVAELKADPAACTLLPDATSPAAAPETGAETGGGEDALGALLGNILDTLSSDELAELPDPVWALLEFIASPDAGDTKG